MLIGKYYFNRFDKDSENDLLFVNEDNSYKHKFVASDGRIWEATGNWQYEWIFKKKTDAKGNVTAYKARLVAKGF
jgi:hypothetical protein